MSCSTCARDAAPTLAAVGIPADQVMATWADKTVGMTWEYLPRCPRCGKWVSPRTGICNYARCGLKGTQVTEPTGWPPAGVTLLSRKRQVEAIRATTGQAAPAPPPVSVDRDGNLLVEAEADPTAALLTDDDDDTMLDVLDLKTVSLAAMGPRNQDDYVITEEDHIGEGGSRTKYKDNVAAIKLLKQLEAEDRPATPEEMAVLVKYVGWGGLSQAFDRYRPLTVSGNEYQELKDLLTDEEWESARASTPNAHYTSPEVIRAMWAGLQRLGFEEGTVLEPAAGVGHFFGCEPPELTAKSTRVAVELDTISGRIAQKLYPDANVHVCGFQEANLPDGFFDVVISNVPFGNYGVYDPEFKNRKYLSSSIHNYFFAKSLDKVRPGGVVAFITSHYTLDSESSKVRDYLASQADLLGAVRLPNTAFKGNAKTEVTTDIIFLRKRAEGEEPGDTSWTKSVPQEFDVNHRKETLPVSQYFIDHPEQMMGTLAAAGAMYRGGELTLESDGRDLTQSLNAAMSRLPKDVVSRDRARCPACKAFVSAGGVCNNPNCPLKRPAYQSASSASPAVRDGSFVIGEDGKIYENRGGRLQEAGGVSPRMEGLIAIRDAARQVLALNIEGADDAVLRDAQDELNRVYDEFVSKYGPITDKRNQRAFKGDPDFPFLLALEDYDPETKTATKAHIFNRRTINVQEPVTSADTAKDALLISLDETGQVDWKRMSTLTGLSEDELRVQLAGQIYRTPEGDWETAEQYLSGNVRKKLRAAEAAASVDPTYQVDVDALRQVQPRDLLPSEINAALGSGWIPTSDVEDFAHHLFSQAGRVKVGYVEAMGKWTVEPNRNRWFNKRATVLTSVWGTRRVDGLELLKQALNGKVPTVYDRPEPNGPRVLNQAQTLAAREMRDKIRQEFRDWVWQDPDRAARLTTAYNELFNATVPRKYDGSHLTLPGIGATMPALHLHQKNAIWRIVQSQNNTLLGHIVGAGKTFVMIGAGMEQRRLGMRHKVMHAIPNHMLEQYGKDFLRMYPGASVLLVSARDLGNAQKRAETMSRIATNDWDAVVVTHSALGKLPVKDETFNSFLQQEISTLDDYLTELRAQERSNYSSRKSKTVKEIEKAKRRLEVKLKERADRGSKDETLTWEELGVDQLYVDEAHKFKNLYFPTQRNRVAGISQSESNRAFDMFIKTQFLTRRCAQCGRFVGMDGVCPHCLGKTRLDGGGVVFATGTPVANSVCEMYTMQRYLQLDHLKEMGMGHFDAWAAQFGDTVTSLEMKPSGSGYREYTRFAKFENVPELLRMFWQVADVQVDPDKLGLDRPRVASGQAVGVSAPASDELREFIQECTRRAENLSNVDPSDDNMLKIVTEANRAALDMRLIDPSLPDDLGSKVNLAVSNIDRIYRNSTGVTVPGMDGPQNMAQMVFLDTSTPGGKSSGGFNVYDDMKQKLVAAGIPEEEIAFIHDAKTDKDKLALFDEVNAGKVRILFGSTEKMGSGTNAQRRLVALHHIDAPWRPADVEQREGRILRPGNLNPEVTIMRYVTEESFDVYKWQLLQSKARFIAQVMMGDLGARTIEDLDAITIGYAEMKALATGNPVIIEKVKVESELRKYTALRRAHRDKVYGLQQSIRMAKDNIAATQGRITRLEAARQKAAGNGAGNGAGDGAFSITIGGQSYTKQEDAGTAFMTLHQAFADSYKSDVVGELHGCPIRVTGRGSNKPPEVVVEITPDVCIPMEAGVSPTGNVTRLQNTIKSLPIRITRSHERITRLQDRIAQETVEMGKPFEHQKTIATLTTQLAGLDAQIAAINESNPSAEQVEQVRLRR